MHFSFIKTNFKCCKLFAKLKKIKSKNITVIESLKINMKMFNIFRYPF